MTSPDRTEAAEYSLTYINQAPDGDIFSILDRQSPEALAFFRGISEELALESVTWRPSRRLRVRKYTGCDVTPAIAAGDGRQTKGLGLFSHPSTLRNE